MKKKNLINALAAITEYLNGQYPDEQTATDEEIKEAASILDLAAETRDEAASYTILFLSEEETRHILHALAIAENQYWQAIEQSNKLNSFAPAAGAATNPKTKLQAYADSFNALSQEIKEQVKDV